MGVDWAGRRGNVVAAVLVLATAATMFVASGDLPSPGRDSDPGAAGYPRILAVSLAVLALMLLFQRGSGEPLPRPRDALRVAAVTVLTIAYVNVLAGLGYILATSLFLVGALLLSRVRHPVPLVAIPPIFSGLVYYLFHIVFEVSLPRGVLERLIT